LTPRPDFSTLAIASQGVEIMSEKSEGQAGGRELSRHILPTSGTMIGICTTLIGLVKVIEGRIGPSRVDEFAALTSLFFLTSAVTSYLSIRFISHARLSKRFETTADLCFIIGLVSIASIGLLFAYEAI
jgi:hypothetical protein